MTRQAQSRLQRLVLAGMVALAILLLLLRMFVFVHGRRGYRGARSSAPVAMGTVQAASQGTGSGWSERVERPVWRRDAGVLAAGSEGGGAQGLTLSVKML